MRKELSATLNTKSSARHRRLAECGQRSVVGTEACGFVRRRFAVRTSSSCAVPTGTNAARRADTKTEQALRRGTKRLRDSSRTVSLPKRSVRSTVESFTRSHGGTEVHVMLGSRLIDRPTSPILRGSVTPCETFTHAEAQSPLSRLANLCVLCGSAWKHRSDLCKRPTPLRDRGVSLFVLRRTGGWCSCRTVGARSCRHHRENPKGEGSRAATGDATGIRPDDVRVASIAQCAISRRWRFVVARSAETAWLTQGTDFRYNPNQETKR